MLLNKGFQLTLALWFHDEASQHRCKSYLYIKARPLWESLRECSKMGTNGVLHKRDKVLDLLGCVVVAAGAPFC